MGDRKASKFMFFLVVYYAVFMLFVMPIGIMMSGLSQYEISDLAASPVFLVMTQVFGLLLPLVIWTVIKRENILHFIPRRKMGGRNVVLIILLSFFIQPSMMAVSGLTTLFFPNQVAEFVGEIGAAHSFWVLILAIAVTPSIVEELVFRGYIQVSAKNLPLKRAALLNGLFFGIIHFNLQQFFYAFAMGVVLMLLVHYTGSILAGMLSHFVINGTQVTILQLAVWLQAGISEEYAAIAESAMGDPPGVIVMVVSVGLMVLITLPVAIIIFRHFVRHNIERKARLDAEKTFDQVVDSFEPVPDGGGTIGVDADESDERRVIPVTNESLPSLEEDNQARRFMGKFDPFVAAIIGVYLFVMFIIGTL